MNKLIFCSTLIAAFVACATPDPPPGLNDPIPLQDAAPAAPPTPTIDAGDQDASDDGGPPPLACSLMAQSTVQACTDCMVANCVPECLACAANATCTAVFTCINSTCVTNGVTSSACGESCAIPYLGDTAGMNLVFSFVSNLGKTSGCILDSCNTTCVTGP